MAMVYLLAAGAVIWAAGPDLPIMISEGLWLVLFALFQILLMLLSVPATAFGSEARGYLSFDRLPLVAAVLVFGAVPAALAGGAAALTWTFLADPRREPLRPRSVRALANTGMFALATMAGGLAYTAIGGSVPLRSLALPDLGRACVLILALQGINELLFVAMSWRSMSTAQRLHPVDWRSTLTEVLLSLTGVITAVAFVTMPLAGFILYAAFIVSVAILFRRVMRVIENERRQTRELTAVNRVNQTVSAAAGLDEIIETIFHEVRGLIDFAAFILGVYDHEANELDIRLNYDDGIRHLPGRRKPGEGLLAWTLEHRESVLIRDARSDHHPSIRSTIIVGRPPISILAVPVTFENQAVGVISVQDYRPNAFTEEDRHLLEGFATQVAVGILNTRLFSELRNQQHDLENRVASRTAALERTTASLKDAIEQKEILLQQLERENRRDPLTNLPNRRHLDAALRQELYRAERFGHHLSIAMCDLDHFKNVNDKLGHALGDNVLRAVADIFRTELRATDLAARYGGEEFVILFPETGREDALNACEKLRTVMEHHSWERVAEGLRVTMSFGVATLNDYRQTAEQLLASADRALYRAKRCGRNRVSESLLPFDTGSDTGG